ncbi:MAG: hypothetical protein LBE09_07680 [Christensenellaceae bacterium]|nr:hypothetical protein [Christensenellaceae bacterium]
MNSDIKNMLLVLMISQVGRGDVKVETIINMLEQVQSASANSDSSQIYQTISKLKQLANIMPQNENIVAKENPVQAGVTPSKQKHAFDAVQRLLPEEAKRILSLIKTN